MTALGDRIRQDAKDAEAVEAARDTAQGMVVALSDQVTNLTGQNAALSAEVIELNGEAQQLTAQVAQLQQDLADCQGQPGPGPGPDPEPGTPPFYGTVALQQVASVAEVGQSAITAAIGTPGVTTLSLRVPDNAIDASFSIFEAGRRRAEAEGIEFAVRWMFGRWVAPTAQVGRTYAVSGGTGRCPVPFNTDGSVNDKAVTYHAERSAALAAWCRTNGVPILHLPWFGRDWAEIANGTDVRNLAGYSYANWLAAHKRIVDEVAHLAGPDLSLEFPMSGSGPLTKPGFPFIEDMTAYLPTKIDPRYVYVQANGVDNDGVWGAPDQATEQAKDAAWSPAVLRGLQMINPGAYDWTAVYAQKARVGGRYLEVYCPSFSGTGSAQLRAEILKDAA